MNADKIYRQLKEKVVGQDAYVKQLSILGFKHELNQKLIADYKTPVNNNLLVVGPTGCGKTFAAKELSRILDVPFYEVDCSNIVQTGYKGMTSVEHILTDAVSRLKSGVRHAIIYLDEFDKVYDQGLDVRGEGTAQQQNFLKMLEPNEVIFKRNGGRYDDSACYLDTAGISFIATGSFDFVRRKQARRSSRMGFDTRPEEKRPLTKDDIIAAGFIPELIGRFGTIVNLNELTKDDYYRILVGSKDSAYTQYQDFFSAANVRLSIDDSVFRKIADEAIEKKIGARGLNDVLGNYLVDAVYDVSCDETISRISISSADGQVAVRYGHRKPAKKARGDDSCADIEMALIDGGPDYDEPERRRLKNAAGKQSRRAEGDLPGFSFDDEAL